MTLSRADVMAIRFGLDHGFIINTVGDLLEWAETADAAMRCAVETLDEIGQEGETYVERLRAALLPESE